MHCCSFAFWAAEGLPVRPRCLVPPRTVPAVHHMSFSPHGWSGLDGLPLLLRKQPIWAVGDTSHLMPAEQGLPWLPVTTGLAGQAIPFIVAASHAHALPSPPFWFPVPAVLVASPGSLCSSSLSAVLALVPPGVAPAFHVSVLLLALSVGAPGCPCRAPPPVPPACPPPPARGFHISVQRGLSDARLDGHGPVATPVAGTSRRAGRSPRPCGVRGHLVRGGGGGLLMARSACAAFAGCCSARTSWFPCVLFCVLLGLVSLPCVGRFCAQLFCCLRSSQFRALSFSAGTLTATHAHRNTARQPMDGLWTEARVQQKQSNDPGNNQHILNTPTIGCR